MTTLSAPHAAQIDAPAGNAATQEAVTGKTARGLDALKAQMNALRGGLDSLRRLRGFFDDAGFDEESVLVRARQLIETLPQTEDAGDAAWRIAAVASLTLTSGALSDVDMDNANRLAPGAVGWDLGPEGAEVHAGFTPFSPAALDDGGAASAISGATALTDGIASLEMFEASLPNGLYRILIVGDAANGAEDYESPFGGEISVNDAPMKNVGGAPRERLMLTGGGDLIASSGKIEARPSATGLGVEGWAIVENGQLRVEFADLPEGRAITAIIAEPFEIDNVALQPMVAETLADALGDIAPAAGPESRRERRGPRFKGGSQPSFAASKNATTPSTGGSAASPTRRAAGTGFAASRGRGSNANSSEVPIQQTSLHSSPEPASEDETPPFEERQVLVKRSDTEGPDSIGIAVDLGALLDDAELSGVFMCLSEPCEDTLPIAGEPDLSAAAALLGDWLDGSVSLSEDWRALEAVLAQRGVGSEIAIVYDFVVESDSWTDVEFRASAGSGLFVWLDGAYIFGASESGAFVEALEFEYRLPLPDLSGGTHFLQILSESHVPDQGFAFELRGTPVNAAEPAFAAVPEPGSLMLFGIGLLGLAIILRRKNKK